MSLLHDKISPLIESQFPSFYREEGPLFVSFVKAYYEWLESTNNPLYHSRHLLDYADIDKTLEQFLPYYQAKYIPETPTTRIYNQRDLIKHSADIYRTRGTIQSLKLVFQMLYGEEVEVYYPGDDILKASDGRWYTPRYLEVSVSSKALSFVGKDIYGVTSGARAFVERIDRRVHSGEKIDVLFLSNVVNNEITGSTFVAGEIITDGTGHKDCPIVVGSLGSIEVTTAGSNFNIGQILDVVSSKRGKQGKARVVEAGVQTGRINYVLTDGGYGYTLANTQVIVSSNVLSLATFTSNDATINNFVEASGITQPLANVVYTANTVQFAVGDLIYGANNTNGVFATGILLNANNSSHMLVAPRTTASITIDTLTLPLTGGSFAIGETVYQTNTTANVSVGKVILANSTTVVVDQRYGPFQTNKIIFSTTSGCSANAAAVTTYGYSDLHFANGSITKIYRNANTNANATVSSVTRMNISAKVVGANATAVGILYPTTGGTFAFNANTGVNGTTETIITSGVHRFANGDQVKYLVATGNTAIGGITNNTIYYVANTANNTHLQLATTFGGSPINLTATSVSETGHTLTSVTPTGTALTKTFVSGTSAYVHAANNTSITAEVTAISAGVPGGYQIGQIADTETVYVGTTLLLASNTSNGYILTTPLNAATYGFPNSPTANLSFVIGSVLTQAGITIGSVLSLSNRYPGFNNTAKPFAINIEQIIAAYGKPSRVFLSLNTSTVGGTFKQGEMVQQTVSLPAVDVTLGIVNPNTNPWNTTNRELLRQVRGDGHTVYGEAYTYNSVTKVLQVLVANTANTFNTSNTIVSVASNIANATVTAVAANNINVTARGTILNITNISGTSLVPAQLYLKQKSLQSFGVGTITGVESGATASVTTVSGDYTYNVLGHDAIVDPQLDTTSGNIKTVAVADSGFFYEDGEEVTLLDSATNNTAKGITTVDTMGQAQGYWRGDQGVVSGTKKVQDNEYYQEFSYEVRAGIDRTIYEPAVKSLTHVAGTKMFNKYNKTSENVVEVQGVTAYAIPTTTLTLSAWPSELVATISNPNPYGTGADDNFGWDVALDGNYALAGASNEDEATGIDSGKVYVYDVTTRNYLRTLNNPNPIGTPASDTFGEAIAVSGNYAIIGASNEDSVAGISDSNGKAYIFNVTNGSLLSTLTNPQPGFGSFGIVVAAYGNYAAVGAPSQFSYAGRVHVYNITTGALLYSLIDPLGNTEFSIYSGAEFGNSIIINGSYLIVGAPAKDYPTIHIDSGAAYVYDIATGTLLYTLNNPNDTGTPSGDYFGTSIASTGSYLAIAAKGEQGLPNSISAGSGVVYVYNLSTGKLLRSIRNSEYEVPSNQSSYFGASIHIAGNTLFVGAPYTSAGSGVIYAFDIQTGRMVSVFNNPNVFIGAGGADYFGINNNMGTSGNFLWVGSPYEDDFSNYQTGKVYVFDISRNLQSISQMLVEQKATVNSPATASGYVTSFDPINKKITLTNVTGTFTTSSALYVDFDLPYGTITNVDKNI